MTVDSQTHHSQVKGQWKCAVWASNLAQDFWTLWPTNCCPSSPLTTSAIGWWKQEVTTKYLRTLIYYFLLSVLSLNHISKKICWSDLSLEFLSVECNDLKLGLGKHFTKDWKICLQSGSGTWLITDAVNIWMIFNKHVCSHRLCRPLPRPI